MSLRVLIAGADKLARFRDKLALEGPLEAFADSDALIALDVIVTRRPRAVVIERDFALTSRGAALINRLRADPALAQMSISLISDEGLLASTSPVPPAPSARPGHLDREGTRHAPRFTIRPGVEALIDGNPVNLVDLSIEGAQVTSTTILRPKQRVRIVLSDKETSLRYTGTIAWATFELSGPGQSPRYRAGVAFINPEPDAILAFAERHRAD